MALKYDKISTHLKNLTIGNGLRAERSFSRWVKFGLIFTPKTNIAVIGSLLIYFCAIFISLFTISNAKYEQSAQYFNLRVNCELCSHFLINHIVLSFQNPILFLCINDLFVLLLPLNLTEGKLLLKLLSFDPYFWVVSYHSLTSAIKSYGILHWHF